MRERTAFFTGHRNLSKKEREILRQRLDETLERLIELGVVFWDIGMALGADQMAAFALLRQRERNPAVKFIAVLPCRNQDALWSDADRQTYHKLLSSADKIVYVSEQYFDGCMKLRNEWLVKNSSVCVTYLKNRKSGTGQTVRMARMQGLEVINLAE
ncbi:hypothetical protein AGMMS49975_08500 [Clostridia bacterium]|nr:hypothetical protein AGMMS49975_08500 [Clostridia bacterium]